MDQNKPDYDCAAFERPVLSERCVCCVSLCLSRRDGFWSADQKADTVSFNKFAPARQSVARFHI